MARDRAELLDALGADVRRGNGIQAAEEGLEGEVTHMPESRIDDVLKS